MRTTSTDRHGQRRQAAVQRQPLGVQRRGRHRRGTKIIFRLEGECVIANGQMEDGGQIFDRDARVGVEDQRFGKLAAGFQNTIARGASAIYRGAYGAATVGTGEGGWTNSNNFKQMIFYAVDRPARGTTTGSRGRNCISPATT